MDIEAEWAARRLALRQTETDTSGDIHETDLGYLEKCAQSGRQAADFLGWEKIGCLDGVRERGVDEMHEEMYRAVCKIHNT